MQSGAQLSVAPLSTTLFHFHETCHRACTHPPTGITHSMKSLLVISVSHVDERELLLCTCGHLPGSDFEFSLRFLCFRVSSLHVSPLATICCSHSNSQDIERKSSKNTTGISSSESVSPRAPKRVPQFQSTKFVFHQEKFGCPGVRRCCLPCSSSVLRYTLRRNPHRANKF